MNIKLVLVSAFETEFKGNNYYIYQFVDSATLTILNYSTTLSQPLEVGKTYDCIIGIKKNKLIVVDVK